MAISTNLLVDDGGGGAGVSGQTPTQIAADKAQEAYAKALANAQIAADKGSDAFKLKATKAALAAGNQLVAAREANATALAANAAKLKEEGDAAATQVTADAKAALQSAKDAKDAAATAKVIVPEVKPDVVPEVKPEVKTPVVTHSIKAEQDASNATANDAKNNINVAGNVPLPATGTITADQTALEYQKAQDALNKVQARQSAIDNLTARFNQYGLGSLAERIKALAVDGATEATITLSLQESPEYQARFKANAVRLKNNLSVLTPAEYLNLEDGYRQVLSTYGLTQFSNDEYVSQFIANDMSATELNSRVTTAVQRIQNADPAVTSTLRDFYGITNADLVGYVLDPKQNIDVIQKKVTAAEIGTAARAQGLNTGTSAEQLAGYQASAAGLAAQGVTQGQAQKGYSAIADILPTAEKLSAIYGDTTGGGYGQTQAEQEMFGQLASAQRARQKLTAKEIANFSGSSGTSKGAFSTGYLNKQSAAGQF